MPMEHKNNANTSGHFVKPQIRELDYWSNAEMNQSKHTTYSLNLKYNQESKVLRQQIEGLANILVAYDGH